MAKTKIPRVAVPIDTATGWGRRVLRGIINYTRKHEPWYLWINALGEDTPVRLPRGWRGEGIIAPVNSRRVAQDIAEAAVPVVNVSVIKIDGVDLPRVTTDLAASAQLAAEHFIDRGFRNFAYCSLQRKSYVEHHYYGFAHALAEAGHECELYKPGRGAGNSAAWHVKQRDLTRWLETLPKPVAILTWRTQCGREVIDACRWAGLTVPEQVAVLGGDEDDLLCEACSPPLSGIALTSTQIGYEAAALLDRLMRGRRPPKEPILIEPTGVVTRQSTDTMAIDDDEMVQAIKFIRDHAAEPIRVKDVLRVVPVSRCRLEWRFQRVLGRTPAAEIRRVHLDRAKQLLAETDLSIPDVAAASGFGSPEYLACAFKSATGLTPYKYRSKVRGR